MQLAIFFKTATVPLICEKIFPEFYFVCIPFFNDYFVADKNVLV
jgi:hypothetical protein